MKIDSPRFGCLEVETNKIIEFPKGLPGFETCTRFTLIEVEGPSQAMAILQSADDPEVAFAVTTPDVLGLRYEFVLTDEEEQLLKITNPEDVVVMLILRCTDEAGAVAKSPLQANLMAPLVFNAASMLGLQKVIARLGCDVTLRPLE
jgi:flagellar assembly factor FliW